ncbi:hypothetical protein V4890_18625 [Ralstonia solanacearum species complex bacterium KE056]|uniref:hypothetical protein n=1 Tax=Ralstonia solanacearum species complex bacterium KE056 TaxID=3119585 RepID=UPI002FC2E942
MQKISNPHKLSILGATIPLLAIWIYENHFSEISRGIIFFFITAPFFIGLSVANAVQDKNKERISELLGMRPPSNAPEIMSFLAKHGDDAARNLSSKYWKTHLVQMYLGGHAIGWLALIITHFIKWNK